MTAAIDDRSVVCNRVLLPDAKSSTLSIHAVAGQEQAKIWDAAYIPSVVPRLSVSPGVCEVALGQV